LVSSPLHKLGKEKMKRKGEKENKYEVGIIRGKTRIRSIK
jgi:hypothetical protein